ncbi:DUF2059 domain-containing protein [uncultured Gilvimarinus sp.]|uniref:DUF2059 domain-containing protein n=1 Tax=uncultured Gilvimarinus sp. TaxID=1689143 RepID=UPI0030D9326B
MKKLLAAALMTLCMSTQAAEPVYELMDLVGSKDQMDQMSTQMVTMIVSSNPALEPHRDDIQAWTTKYFTWDAMKDDMAEIYRKYFTDDEIKKLIEFYETPVGQKAIEVMPQLFQEGSQIGMRIAQEHQAELQAILEKAQSETEAEPDSATE